MTLTKLPYAGFGQTTQQQQQQQQQQQPANPYDAIHNAILNCNMFGDERDTTLARWNLLQALWGTGKGMKGDKLVTHSLITILLA